MTFEQSKTLIVVYKDELYCNYLKKLVETKRANEDGSIDRTRSDINIVAWTEKVWLSQKKAGNINDRVLFLGDVKGTDKLLPIIDVKYDKYGILLGWAGKQAILHIDSKVLIKNGYSEFFNQLYLLPVPESSKVRAIEEPKVIEKDTSEVDNNNQNKNKFAKAIGEAAASLGVILDPVDGAVAAVATASISEFKAGSIQKQQFFFGIHELCENHLEEYMNN